IGCVEASEHGLVIFQCAVDICRVHGIPDDPPYPGWDGSAGGTSHERDVSASAVQVMHNPLANLSIPDYKCAFHPNSPFIPQPHIEITALCFASTLEEHKALNKSTAHLSV